MVKIRELRQAKKMTLAELADILGVSVVTVSRYERGERGIDLDTAARIATVLGCAVDDLIDAKAPA